MNLMEAVIEETPHKKIFFPENILKGNTFLFLRFYKVKCMPIHAYFHTHFVLLNL